MKSITTFTLSALILGSFLLPQTAFALTTLQIDSILGLLRAFNAEEQVIQRVSESLRGRAALTPPIPNEGPGVETYTPPTPVIPDETGGVEFFEPELPQIPDETGGVETYTPPTPTLSLRASPSSVSRGGQVTLSWESNNSISCTLKVDALGGDVVERPEPLNEEFPDNIFIYGPSGTASFYPQVPTLYTMTCRGTGGAITQSQNVSLGTTVVNPQPEEKQTRIINGNNLYSPDVVHDGNETWVYFGGWLTQGEVHDNIYRATCTRDLTSCSGIQKVIDAQQYGFDHFNDPSLVRMPGGYYIMYMTGLPDGDAVESAANNDIYFATSWVGDGVNWSAPKLLVESNWLPAPVIGNDGNVYLYANDAGGHGKIVRMNMGPSGVGLQETTRVSYGTPDDHFNNIDVMKDARSGGYKIVAERPTFPGSEIDIFTSTDGLLWSRAQRAAVVPAEGEYRVGTPSWNQNNENQIVFASTKQSDSMGFKIYQTTLETQQSALKNMRDRIAASINRAVAGAVRGLGGVFSF